MREAFPWASVGKYSILCAFQLAGDGLRHGGLRPPRRNASCSIANMDESDEVPGRDWHHLEALRARKRELDSRIAEIERLGSRDDPSGVLSGLDERLVRLIVTELAESASTVNREWELAALSERRGDLGGAMAHLAKAYVQIHSVMPNQIEDVGDAIWEALAMLEARLKWTKGPGVVE